MLDYFISCFPELIFFSVVCRLQRERNGPTWAVIWATLEFLVSLRRLKIRTLALFSHMSTGASMCAPRRWHLSPQRRAVTPNYVLTQIRRNARGLRVVLLPLLGQMTMEA